MMPSTLSIILFSLTASTVFAACPNNGGSISFTGACSAVNIQSQGCDLISGGFSAAQIEAACDAAASSFGASTDKYYQHDKAYMDGGSSFNDDRITKMTVDAGRVMRFRSVVNRTRVLWPQYKALEAYVPADQKPYMSNFNLTSSCGLRAAMCCFTDTRNITLLQDNTDICHHDYASSRRSNHVYNGFGVYNSSSPAYCVAFAWAADRNSPSNRYKGNSLFDVAFGTFLDKGYIKNGTFLLIKQLIQPFLFVTSRILHTMPSTCPLQSLGLLSVVVSSRCQPSPKLHVVPSRSTMKGTH